MGEASEAVTAEKGPGATQDRGARVDDPVFGTTYRFARELQQGGVEVERVEAWVEPSGGVPAHVHPRLEERFTLLEGELELLEGRRWRRVEPGESVDVPPGTRHAFRNPGATTSHFVARATPPMSLAEFLTDAAALSRAGLINRHGLPTRPRSLLWAAALIERNREMAVLGFPLPPRRVQGLVFGPLAALARRRGIETGSFAEQLGV